MNAKLVVNQECHGLELYFPEKPDEEVLSQLKSARWRYHRVKKCWYAKQNAANQEIAEQIASGIAMARCVLPRPVCPWNTKSWAASTNDRLLRSSTP